VSKRIEMQCIQTVQELNDRAHRLRQRAWLLRQLREVLQNDYATRPGQHPPPCVPSPRGGKEWPRDDVVDQLRADLATAAEEAMDEAEQLEATPLTGKAVEPEMKQRGNGAAAKKSNGAARAR
jgi:hypothetical protein